MASMYNPDGETASPGTGDDPLDACEDCGEPGSACPGCGKVVCQTCAEAEGEFCRCFPLADGAGGNGPSRPESATDLDPISGPIIPGDRWNRTAGGPNAPETPPAEGWRIRDLDHLNQTLGRMARLERIREENREVVAKEVARKQEWLAKEDEALAKRYRDLEAHVYEFARDNRETLGKTRRLPNGTVAWKEKDGYYRYDQRPGPDGKPATAPQNVEKLLKWAQVEELKREAAGLAPQGFIEQVPRPVVARIKAWLTAKPAVAPRPAPPGLEWVGPGESLSIVVKERP